MESRVVRIGGTAESGFTEITSGRVFLQEKVVETICQDNLASDRLFSYLANSIEREGNSIPYSFITAMDRYKGISFGR